MSLTDLRLQCELLSLRWGRLTIACAALGLSLIVLLTVVLPLQLQARRSAQTNLIAQLKSVKTPLPMRASASAEVDQLMAQSQDKNKIGRDMVLRAHQAGITLGRIEFLVEPPEWGWQAYTISVPMQGAYGDMQKFAFLLLAAHPNLALEKMHFERHQMTAGASDAVRAQFYFRLFVGVKHE